MGETGQPFSGRAGRRLFRWLATAGWQETEFRQSAYMTSITKCYPGPSKSGRGDRAPSRSEQRLCAVWLDRELALVDPEVVVTIGALAVARFLGQGRKLVELVGQQFHIHDRTIIPLPHPSGASFWRQEPENQRLLHQALQHLAQIKEELERQVATA